MSKVEKKRSYKAIMKQIDELLVKGKGNILKKDLKEYQSLALEAQKLEQARYRIELPETIEGILELAMYQERMKQKDLAVLLEVSETKLSLVIKGKQRPDVKLLKSIHEKLGIDGNMLLEAV